jgi:hypothetical protein
LIEDIDVCKKIIVLLLALNESVLDFQDICESCGFFDGCKGLVNNLHISLIVIDEFHLLLIVND